MTDSASTREVTENDIAIVGMAGRFPGADDVDEFWEHVAAGDDCLSEVPPENQPVDRDPEGYVARDGALRDVAGFDGEFFGIGARDAAVMDPQHRHFLETSWAALESAAIVPSDFAGAIGVFGGCGMNTYLINNLLTNPKVLPGLGWFLLRHTGNDKDFFTNNVAYRLNLTGPAINVQTACSTSLVAVHLAVQSLLSFECDAAIAGGATIEVPHGAGYQYQEGEILSPDGHCRAYDAASGGTVLTSGVGAVVLRRASEAIADGDPIQALIKATAINNDGSRKVSFLAPSVDGHADVVREALSVAELSARDIQLVEGHGTGTPVGDPVEAAALTEAFRTWTDETNFCRLVSTKPNIGHLDTAAGVASVIKVVQALRHRTLPPLANFTGPSPLLDLDRSPFVISGEAAPWPGDAVRRAGVSSLGVGGTNAHIIVEEAPPLDLDDDVAAPTGPFVLPVSARSKRALNDASAQLATALEGDPDLDLTAVAHTLWRGRTRMPHRRVVVAESADRAVHVLRNGDRKLGQAGQVSSEPGADQPRVSFMFPGGGAQYVGMGSGLDDRFDVFHSVRTDGAAIIRDLGGPDLTSVLAAGAPTAGADELMRTASVSLPAVFLTSVALARQALAFGVEPVSMIGHSLGEYVAAHLAEVMSFEDALKLVVTRSRLMQECAGVDTAMLAVPLGEAELADIVPAGLSIATINAEDECVVSGPRSALDPFAAELAANDRAGTLIPLSAAAHSALLDPVLDEFEEVAASVDLRPPTSRYLSNVTGDWIRPEQATDAHYWATHLRQPVRFEEGLRRLLSEQPTVLLELGPGQSLSSYARRNAGAPIDSIPTLRHPEHDVPDTVFTVGAFARLWNSGADFDLDRFIPEAPRRLTLPTYPFQHEHCWIEPGVAVGHGAPDTAASAPVVEAPVLPERIDDLDQSTWIPSWTPIDVPTGQPTTERFLFVTDDTDGASDFDIVPITAALRDRGAATSIIAADDDRDRDDVIAEFDVVVVAASADPSYEAATQRWLGDAASWAAAAGRNGRRLICLTGSALHDADRPSDALALGPAGVAPHEYPGMTSCVVDVGALAGRASDASIADAIATSALCADHMAVVSLDGRWHGPDLRRQSIDSAAGQAFVHGGRYLVTGALGGIGHLLADHLATTYDASLVVVSSRPIPAPAERRDWLDAHGPDDATSRRIRQLELLERDGRTVDVVVADLAGAGGVADLLDTVQDTIGALDGVIHAAGVVDDRLLEMAELADHRAVVDVKARAALDFATELTARSVPSLVLVSSTSTDLAPEGQTGYVAANAVLDTLATDAGATTITTVNYGLWADVGIASQSARRVRLGLRQGDPVEHPVFAERIDHPDGSVDLVGTIRSDAHWVVDEHRTNGGLAVLPASGHIDLLLSACSVGGRSDAALAGIMFIEPLRVPDDADVRVRVHVGPESNPTIRLDSDAGHGLEWTTHSEGRFDVGLPEPDAPGDLQFGDPVHIDPVERLRQHLRIGPRWNAVTSVSRGDGAGRATLALGDEFRTSDRSWTAHPALVDAAIAVSVDLLDPDGDDLRVPVGVAGVRSLGAVEPDAVATVMLRSDSDDRVAVVDITLSSTDGRVLLQIDGLELLSSSADDLGALDAAGSDAAVAAVAAPTTLLDAADVLGLRAPEGIELLERAVHGPHPRVIASSIDLADLHRWQDATRDAAAQVDDARPVDSGESLEAQLVSAWEALLGIDDIDLDSDFFDLGGHSLIAIRLLSGVRRDHGVRLQLSDLFEGSTVRDLAAMIRERRGDDPVEAAELTKPSGPPTDSDDGSTDEPASSAPPASTNGKHQSTHQHIVKITSRGDETPLFVVHGAGGGVLFLAEFARALGSRPVYGIAAIGTHRDDTPDESVTEMADRYTAELVAAHDGPYLLGGYSGGGLIALEMANRLRAAGHVVLQVVLFDSVPPGKAQVPYTTRFRRIGAHARSKGVSAIKPFTHTLGTRWLDSLLLDRATVAPEPVDDDDYVDLFDHMSRVLDEHTPTSYDVDVVLARADAVWPMQPDDYHWSRHLKGRFDVFNVPGDHISMFQGENAVTVADRLRPLLPTRSSVEVSADRARG